MESMRTVVTVCLCLWWQYCLISPCRGEDNQVITPKDNNEVEFKEAKSVRYLLYDVNGGEGFNLRRDVYIRVANLVKLLNEDAPWVLVLPPWGRLYHWQSREIDQIRIPWSLFFDIESLRRHIPVMEFEEYLKISPEATIDEVYYLQRYKEGWDHWEEKLDIRECLDRHTYRQEEDGTWRSWFFGYEDEVSAKKFSCMSYMGHIGFMKPFLLKNSTARSVMIDRAESLIHGQYSEFHPFYWTGRRSMVFANHLKEIGNKFREEFLDSTDEKDKTVMNADWTKNKKKHGDAVGGPYLSVHLRRKDYLYGHGDEVPSLADAAKQVKRMLKKQKLKKVFVCTDAPQNEFEQFKEQFDMPDNVYRFRPTKEIHEKYKDGGVAIIDQWIAAHAKFFIGSYVSTFSFRIQEERELMGFEPDMTFNRLCNSDSDKCEQPTKWPVLY